MSNGKVMSVDGGMILIIFVGLLFAIGIFSITMSIIYEPDYIVEYKPLPNSHRNNRPSENIVSNDYEEYDVIINDQ